MIKNYILYFFLLCSILLTAQRKININEEKKIEPEISSQQQRELSGHFKTLKNRLFTINTIFQNPIGIQNNDVIELNLFNNKIYEAIVNKVEKDINGTIVISARIVGFPMGYAIITTSSGKSLLYIEIPELQEKYISGVDSKTRRNQLMQLEANNLGELVCKDVLIPEIPQEKMIWQTFSDTGKGLEDPAQIDIMIVYTPAAKKWADINEKSIQNTIAQIMTKSNLVLDNSKVNVKLNLVHSREINYVESGNSGTDLDRLTSDGDGFMDEVHQWRNQYNADLVVFLANVEDTGGLAWRLNNPTGTSSYGFSLNRIKQASWTYTVIHEIGHNMGMGHHKQQLSHPGPGLYDYSAGWRWKGDDGKMYSSVMTYNNSRDFPDGIYSVNVPYFSSPPINYAGYPTGHNTEADGQRNIKQIKHVIAEYRKLNVICNSPSGLSLSDITDNTIRLGWNTVSTAQNYTIEYKLNTSDSWITLPVTTSTFVNISNLTSETTYNWRVKANCGEGNSSGYTESSFTTISCIYNYEPNNSIEEAYSIELNKEYNAGIGIAGDMDYYKFTLSEDRAVKVSLSNLPKDYDLIIYNNSGVSIGSSKKSGTSNDVVSFNALASGVYYIQVYGAGSNYDIDKCYTLQVSTKPALNLAPENLSVTGITQNNARISWASILGIKDYTLEYKASTTNTWTSLTLTDTYTYLSDLVSGQLYQVRIKANYSAALSSQFNQSEFTTQAMPKCIMNYEPNNSIEEAYSIELNKEYNAGIGIAGDMDYYKFTLSEDRAVEVSLSNLPKDYDLIIYNNSGVSIGSSKKSGTSNDVVSFNALASGVYYIQVYGAGSNYDIDKCYTLQVSTKPALNLAPENLSVTGITQNNARISWASILGIKDYTLEYKASTTNTWTSLTLTDTYTYLSDLVSGQLYQVRIKANYSAALSSQFNQSEFTTQAMPKCIMNYEPNNSIEEAYSIELNKEYNAGIGIAGDMDYYKFTLSEDRAVEVSLSNLPKDYDLIIYNNSGVSIGSSKKSGTSNDVVSFNALASGVYYIQVYGAGSNYDIDKCYTLQVSTKPALNLAPENLSVTGITQNNARISWASILGIKDYTLEYKASTTNTWTSLTLTDTYTYLSDLVSGQLYQVRIKANYSAALSSQFNQSEFTTQAMPKCIMNYEPNNSIEEAYSIELNKEYNAGIGIAGDMDYYKFTLSEDRAVEVSLSNLPKDYDLIIYNNSGVSIGSSKKSGTSNDVVSFNALASGVYYIQVYGAGSNYDIDKCYTLQVSNKPSALSKMSILNNELEKEIETSSPTLYPNPVKDKLYIKNLKPQDKDYINIHITDRSGRIVKTESVKNGKIIIIDVTTLSPNIYYINLDGKAYTFVKD